MDEKKGHKLPIRIFAHLEIINGTCQSADVRLFTFDYSSMLLMFAC